MTREALVEADFIFYDRLPAPCVIFRLEDLAVAKIIYGDDISYVIPFHLVVIYIPDIRFVNVIIWIGPY